MCTAQLTWDYQGRVFEDYALTVCDGVLFGTQIIRRWAGICCVQYQRVYVCMYVYMYVCTYVCIYVCMYVCM